MTRPLMHVVLFAEGVDGQGEPVLIAYELRKATVTIEHEYEYANDGHYPVNGMYRPDSSLMNADIRLSGTLVGGVMFATHDVPEEFRAPRLHKVVLYEGGAAGWTCAFPSCTWTADDRLSREKAERNHDERVRS